MGVSVRYKREYRKTEEFLTKFVNGNSKSGGLRKIQLAVIRKYADEGLRRLRDYTPKDTGLTASSWYYEVEHNVDYISVVWKNRNVNKGVNIAIILQYGHGTRGGGYVAGRDYINPAMRPVFDKMAEDMWLEVTKS